MSRNFADLSAGELLTLFRRKKASPLEAAKNVLARITALNDGLNVFRLI